MLLSGYLRYLYIRKTLLTVLVCVFDAYCNYHSQQVFVFIVTHRTLAL